MMAQAEEPAGEAVGGPLLNINVGVLGHIDSGKTSLAKAMSTVSSTASFDRSPQEKARGITLDLGFSCLRVATPQHIQGFAEMQLTLVDCPGHASLIKTIIGGAQIIDIMVLVIDVTKGVQTQTAECLVIGEITCSKLIVVLNKADLVEATKRAAKIAKVKAMLTKTLASTRFADAPMVAVSAKPGGPESSLASEGIPELIEVLRSNVTLPERDPHGSFSFAVDHCFAVRGQGTVLTGTCLSGSMKVNDTIEIPALQMTKKVKSMQMFRKPLQEVRQGDRAGICVTQFDPSLMERGVICHEGTLQNINGAVARVRKIRFFKGDIKSKSKLHVSIGHETVMATVTFFEAKEPEVDATLIGAFGPQEFDVDQEFLYHEDLPLDEKGKPVKKYWAVMEFQSPVTCAPDALCIGSRLDTDVHSPTCRLAFHGRLALVASYRPGGAPLKDTFLPQLKVYKPKQREGVVDRLHDEYTVIGTSLFKKETRMDKFIGMQVRLSTGEKGEIQGVFGTSGKFKVYCSGGLLQSTKDALAGRGKKKKGPAASTAVKDHEPQVIHIIMSFKRLVFDKDKVIRQ